MSDLLKFWYDLSFIWLQAAVQNCLIASRDEVSSMSESIDQQISAHACNGLHWKLYMWLYMWLCMWLQLTVGATNFKHGLTKLFIFFPRLPTSS